MTREEQMQKKFDIRHKILHIRYMVDLLTQGAEVTPITKGLFGYKCNQDIIERDKNLMENLVMIQKYLHELCEMTKDIPFE